MTVEENKTEQAQSQEQATQAPKQEAVTQPAPQQAASVQPAPAKKMSTGKKVGIIAGIVVAILVVCAGGFMIYQNQQKEAAKKEAVAKVNDFYSDIHNSKSDFAKACKQSMSATVSSLKQFGITEEDMYNLMLSRLDAKQKGDAQVSDDGKEVTVTYEISNVSLQGAMENYMKDVQTWSASTEAQSLAAAGDKETFYKKIGSLLKDAFKDAPMETADVTFKLKKNDKGEWELEDMNSSNVMNSVFPNQDLS